jgi:hypothetical protein
MGTVSLDLLEMGIEVPKLLRQHIGVRNEVKVVLAVAFLHAHHVLT